MKLKFAVMAGLVAVAMTLIGCVSSLELGTKFTGVVQHIYTAEDLKRDRPEKYQRYLDLGIATEADMQGQVELAYNLHEDVFTTRNSGMNQYAYVPRDLRGKIEQDDFVEVRLVENGTNRSIVTVAERIVQKHGQPGPCKFGGGNGVFISKDIYCNGKSVKIIPPQDKK